MNGALLHVPYAHHTIHTCVLCANLLRLLKFSVRFTFIFRDFVVFLCFVILFYCSAKSNEYHTRSRSGVLLLLSFAYSKLKTKRACIFSYSINWVTPPSPLPPSSSYTKFQSFNVCTLLLSLPPLLQLQPLALGTFFSYLFVHTRWGYNANKYVCRKRQTLNSYLIARMVLLAHPLRLSSRNTDAFLSYCIVLDQAVLLSTY